MDVVVDTGAGCTVARPVGDLDLATAGVLRDRVVSLMNDGHRRIVLDLSDVTFIDSAGIGALVATVKQAHDCGTGFVLAEPRPPVSRVFELTGLAQLVPVAGSVAAAQETLDG